MFTTFVYIMLKTPMLCSDLILIYLILGHLSCTTTFVSHVVLAVIQVNGRVLLQTYCYVQNWPIVHSLGEPAQYRVPVREVGLLLRHVSLAVREHICEVFYKVVGLLLQHLLVQVTQVDEITWKNTSNTFRGNKEERQQSFLWVQGCH